MVLIKSQEGIKRGKNSYENNSKTINKMAIITYILIITLNVNEPNAPTKSHRLPAANSLQSCPTLCNLWSVAPQAPLSMGFSRPE